MTYPDFAVRWRHSDGAERAKFLQDICDLLYVPKLDPTADNLTKDRYALACPVQFNDGAKKSTDSADVQQKAPIRELAEQLDAHCKRQQAQYPCLTLTYFYNGGEEAARQQAPRG